MAHDKMKLGYIQLSKAAPSFEEQQEALKGVGITEFSRSGHVYVDRPSMQQSTPGKVSLPKRASAIAALQPDDELVIASAARLGTNQEDILQALQEISAKGATVYDVEMDVSVAIHPDALLGLAFLVRAESGRRREIAATARARKAELGAHAGPPVKLAGRRLEDAEAAWRNLELSAAQVAEKFEVSRRTLYRLFGPKGTPIFGRKPDISAE